MDFVNHFPFSSRNCDANWVVVDRLTDSAHFILYKRDYTFDRMARLYIQDILRLHGIPMSIVNERDRRFTSQFWGIFQRALGTTLNPSTTYYQETDGQSEKTIQMLKDMPRASIIDLGLSWHDHLPMIEFAYNNIYHPSIDMALFEALFGHRCHTPLFWDEVGERQVEGPNLIKKIFDKLELIKKRL